MGTMIPKAEACVSIFVPNLDSLDQLLLERFGGKVGRGLAVELCGRSHFSRRAESLFTPVLTSLRKDSKASEVSSQS
jgi:hypothetical protein